MDNDLLNLFLFDPKDLILLENMVAIQVSPFLLQMQTPATGGSGGFVQTCPTLRYKQNAYRHKRRKRHDKKPTGIPSKWDSSLEVAVRTKHAYFSTNWNTTEANQRLYI